tara:strand:- start:68 stop:172 length:105 start_codon:yes stop_codon:yes gene_type:complete
LKKKDRIPIGDINGYSMELKTALKPDVLGIKFGF